MGSRKHNVAEARKEANKNIAFAKLRNCPTSPRKMRLVADMIRGIDADKALFMLKYSNKEASQSMEKLLQSAIANWEQKFDETFDDLLGKSQSRCKLPVSVVLRSFNFNRFPFKHCVESLKLNLALGLGATKIFV